MDDTPEILDDLYDKLDVLEDELHEQNVKLDELRNLGRTLLVAQGAQRDGVNHEPQGILDAIFNVDHDKFVFLCERKELAERVDAAAGQYTHAETRILPKIPPKGSTKTMTEILYEAIKIQTAISTLETDILVVEDEIYDASGGTDFEDDDSYYEADYSDYEVRILFKTTGKLNTICMHVNIIKFLRA